MKKVFNYSILVLVAVLVFLFSLSGCSLKKEDRNTNDLTTQSQNTIFNNYPTNTKISYGFVDHTMFVNYLTDGIYRCGSDFQEGNYYIISIYGANALYDVSDSPNDFSWSYQRVFRKIAVKEGQYVKIPSGALLVSCDELDSEDLTKYGIYIVGKDLPEGDYKITSVSDEYYSELENISGIVGAYQISNNNPENEPENCSPLFDKQAYISVRDGQYIIINNAIMVLNGIDIPENDTITISTVETTYNSAISATKADLTGSKGKWYYKGIPLLSEDCDWIDSSLNKEGTVNQGAVYRKIAKMLSGSDFENKRFFYEYTDISKILLGFSPETVEDYIPYGINASEFIVVKNPIEAIMKKFKSLNSVVGEYDFDFGQLGKYTVNILDIAACAKEMQISEEMLGYVIALISEYTTDITFENNTCHIKYTGFEKTEAQPMSKNDFFAEIPAGSSKENIYENMIADGYASYYCYYDSSKDSSEEGVIKTNRGVCLGNSKETVISNYGETNINTFIMQSNSLYQDLLEYSPTEAGIMRSQCSTYISYDCDNLGAIEFYFNENDLLSWIVFYAY